MKRREQSKAERILLFVFALALTPVVFYTVFLTLNSLKEGDTYRNATIISPNESTSALQYGGFYQVRGPIAGALINPEEIPEIKNALQTSIVKEELDRGSGIWSSTTKKPVWTQASEITVGGHPVKLTVASRIMIAPVRDIIQRSETERFRVDYQATEPVDYVAFGMFANGAFENGHHERLIIAPLSEIEPVLKRIDEAGKKKALIMAILSTVFAIFIGLTMRMAVIRPKTPKA